MLGTSACFIAHLVRIESSFLATAPLTVAPPSHVAASAYEQNIPDHHTALECNTSFVRRDLAGPLQRRPHQRAGDGRGTPELIQRNAFAGVGFGEEQSRPRCGFIESRDEANRGYPSLSEVEMIGIAHQREVAGQLDDAHRA